MLSSPEILNPGDVAPLTIHCFCQLSSHHLRNSRSNANRKSFVGICCSSTGRICQHGFAEIITKAKTCLRYPAAPESEGSCILSLLLSLIASKNNPGTRKGNYNKLKEVECSHLMTGSLFLCKLDLAAMPIDKTVPSISQSPVII